MSDKSKQLADWLDGNQPSSVDDEFEAIANTAKRLEAAASDYREQAVPVWDRSAGFGREKQSWWQWQGLPAMSFVTSMAAIFMVLLRVEVSMTEGSFVVSFAGKQQQQQVEHLVNERLDSFTNQQMLALASYADDLQTQQKLANAELVNHVLTSSRQERKEDFVELIDYIQQQREDDRYVMNRQIANLKNAGLQPADYRIDE